MSDLPTFMELALSGYVMADEIEDFVERWHETDADGELHEFLGMSWEEYSLWVAHADNIYIVLSARVTQQPVLEAVNDNLRSANRLAARADDVSKLAALQRWIDAQPDR